MAVTALVTALLLKVLYKSAIGSSDHRSRNLKTREKRRSSRFATDIEMHRARRRSVLALPASALCPDWLGLCWTRYRSGPEVGPSFRAAIQRIGLCRN